MVHASNIQYGLHARAKQAEYKFLLQEVEHHWVFLLLQMSFVSN